MHTVLTLAYWMEAVALLPCLDSKGPFASSARISCKGKVPTVFSAANGYYAC